MALPILDGNQSATTLSTILSSGQHITAHTVVSLGTQAITDMRGAVSGSVVSISNFPATQTIAGTVTANLANVVTTDLYWETQAIKVTGGNGNGIDIAGVDSSGNAAIFAEGGGIPVYPRDDSSYGASFPISGTVTANLGSALPAGTNRIGVVTIGGGTVTIGAGTAEIGTVKPAKSQSGNAQFLSVDDGSGKLFTSTLLTAGTAQIGSVTASISNSVTIGSLPALVAGTANIGSVTASISNSVTIASFATSVTARLINPAGTAVTYAEVGTAGNPSIDVLSVQGVTSGTPINVYPQQGTTVSNTNFTSLTSSTTLVSAVTMRESLTVFNEGAGNLHISPGATCTTVAYQVRLSAGDYWECPQGQLSLAHTAVFATAGTARVTQVS